MYKVIWAGVGDPLSSLTVVIVLAYTIFSISPVLGPFSNTPALTLPLPSPSHPSARDFSSISSHHGNSKSRAMSRNQGVKEFSATRQRGLIDTRVSLLGSANIASSSALDTYLASLTSFGLISRSTSREQNIM